MAISPKLTKYLDSQIPHAELNFSVFIYEWPVMQLGILNGVNETGVEKLQPFVGSGSVGKLDEGKLYKVLREIVPVKEVNFFEKLRHSLGYVGIEKDGYFTITDTEGNKFNINPESRVLRVSGVLRPVVETIGRERLIEYLNNRTRREVRAEE